MALVFADLVEETTTTTGTGSYTLAGAATGFQSFSAGIGTSNETFYAVTDGTDWEVSRGTLSDGTTLTRATVLDSSNSGSAVNWGAGTKRIYAVAPALAVSRLYAQAVNNIGSTGSTVTCDFSAYNVWIFEPTGDLTVNITNVPALTAGTVIGQLIVTGGGDHTLTFQCEGGSGTVVTEGGSGLDLGTTTQVDIVGILQTGTDTVWLKVLNAEALS